MQTNTRTQIKTHVWNVLNTLVTAVHFTQSSKRYLTGHRIQSLKLLYCKNPTVFTAASPLLLIRQGFKAFAEQVHLIQIRIRGVTAESQSRTQLWSFCLRRATFFHCCIEVDAFRYFLVLFLVLTFCYVGQHASFWYHELQWLVLPTSAHLLRRTRHKEQLHLYL